MTGRTGKAAGNEPDMMDFKKERETEEKEKRQKLRGTLSLNHRHECRGSWVTSSARNKRLLCITLETQLSDLFCTFLSSFFPVMSRHYASVQKVDRY